MTKMLTDTLKWERQTRREVNVSRVLFSRFPVCRLSCTLGSRGFSCAVSGFRQVGLWPTKLLVAREKKTSGTQGSFHRRQKTGTPNDGFLLTALKTLFRLSRVLSALQKCILSSAIKFVSLRQSKLAGQLESFRNYKGLRIIFPKILDAILTFTKENFSDSSLHRMFESENFRFPLCTKNRQTWVLKCEKLNSRNSQGIHQICYENFT